VTARAALWECAKACEIYGHHRDWHEHRGIFEGWSRERREAWKTWSVEFTRLEYNDEFPF
jgi:hypothetical protein